MTRQSYQQGYVSDPIHTRRGTAFMIRYRLRAADGKWIHKQETLYDLPGKKAARAVLDRKIRESNNRPIEATQMTLSDFAKAFWKPYLERKQVKPSTRRSYESGLTKHILPKLGDLLVVQVSPVHVENFLRTKMENGSSPKTVRNLLGLLQSIFSLAEDNDLISRSPIRKKHKPQVSRREKPVWTPAQLKSIVEGVPAEYQCLFQCAMLTGARLGELLGLKWKDLDLGNQKLEIRQALWEGQLVLPKTQGSVRTIFFGNALAFALSGHRQLSKNTGPDEFVFCKTDGSPLNPDVLRRDVLYPTLDRLQIPRNSREAGFHTFRHSAGSIVNQQTGNLKLAQRLLGHSNLSTTADVYTHTSTEAERGAALALEQAIYGDLFAAVRENANTNSSAAGSQGN